MAALSWRVFLIVDAYLITAIPFVALSAGRASMFVVQPRAMQDMTDCDREGEGGGARLRTMSACGVGFAVALRDRNPLVYGASRADPRCACRLILLRRSASVSSARQLPGEGTDPRWSKPWPDDAIRRTSTAIWPGRLLQWCSNEMLEAIAEASARTGRRIHVIVSETRYQRDWADRGYPEGMIRYLDNIGLLSATPADAGALHPRTAG